jgi:DeoR/GlpR family transcriptional regulator of sugar metabolism
MLPAEREINILNLVRQRGTISVRELAATFDVAEVTIRRDLQRMEEDALLRRTHGGAMVLEDISPPAPPDPAPDIDALIISPVNNRAAHTLREKAIRHQIPLVSESAPTDNALYLGCRNWTAGEELGQWTGNYILAHWQMATPVVLDITQPNQQNTANRSQGFIAGLHTVLGDAVEIVSVDGQALYDRAYRNAMGVLVARPDINVIFGINDDALLAGLQAYRDLGYDEARLLAVNIGGEGSTIFDALMQRGAFRACVALFPEIVGRMGIDAIAYLWEAQLTREAIYTPYRLVTSDDLPHYYAHQDHTWTLRVEAVASLLPNEWNTSPKIAPGKRIAFVIHYRTHEWYQNVSRAMASRAEQLGIDFTVQDLQEDLATEVKNLRRLIGKVAAAYIEAGETIILDAGTTTEFMLLFFQGKAPFTVLTNSLTVQDRLANQAHINLLLTGGEYNREADALVGRGAHLFLSEIRADKVFIVAGGVSQAFGISSVDPHEAEVRRYMIDAAKEVIALADHTVIGVDSRVKVCDLDRIDTLITDSGIRADQRLALTNLGIKVIVAGQVNGKHTQEGGEA